MRLFKKIGEMFDNILNKITDNPIVKKLIIVVFLFMIIIGIIALLSSCNRQKVYSYEEFENKMVSMAKARYKDKDKLPQEDKGTLEVSLQSFVDNGQINDIQSVLKNGSACTGNVKIINNNGYYLYIPNLDCKDNYQTNTLFETLTKQDNIVSNGNGLYKVNNDYIFRGDNVNNNVVLNGISYQVLRINEDGTIRVLDNSKRGTVKWDDRYNIEKKTSTGINNYVYNNINSRIKDYIENLYNNNITFTDEMRAYFGTTPVCIGKRSINDNIFDTSIECSQTTDSFPFTLISPYEYYLVTLDENCDGMGNVSCTNYNYLNQIGSTWTITGDKDSTFKVYKLTGGGAVLANASTSANAKLVTTLNGELVVQSGDGTSANPYIIKTFDQKKK